MRKYRKMYKVKELVFVPGTVFRAVAIAWIYAYQDIGVIRRETKEA